MIFSSKVLKRWSFQKGPHRNMIFIVLSEKMVFFSQKHDIFFLGWGVRDDLSQEIHGKIFSLYKYGCHKRGSTLLCQKKSKMFLPRKNTHKDD